MLKVKFRTELELDLGNDILNFTKVGFSDVRVVMKDHAPWFVASDICDNLEIKNPWDALTRLDDDEKAAIGLTEVSSNGVIQRREMNIINEYGLYSLILSSRKKSAKKFKRWIIHDVIPKIREYGVYIDPSHYNIRTLSKSIRYDFTVAIADLIRYGVSSGFNVETDKIFAVISSITNKLAGIENGKRDEATDHQLLALMRVESIFTRNIYRCIVTNVNYENIINYCEYRAREELDRFILKIK